MFWPPRAHFSVCFGSKEGTLVRFGSQEGSLVCFANQEGTLVHVLAPKKTLQCTFLNNWATPPCVHHCNVTFECTVVQLDANKNQTEHDIYFSCDLLAKTRGHKEKEGFFLREL